MLLLVLRIFQILLKLFHLKWCQSVAYTCPPFHHDDIVCAGKNINAISINDYKPFNVYILWHVHTIDIDIFIRVESVGQ